MDNITIGDFSISLMENGNIWMVLPDGEGMEISVHKLEKALYQFWDREF